MASVWQLGQTFRGTLYVGLCTRRSLVHYYRHVPRCRKHEGVSYRIDEYQCRKAKSMEPQSRSFDMLRMPPVQLLQIT